jgi:cytochrome c-type biogenesis protein CcmF
VQIGEQRNVGGWQVKLNNVVPVVGQNWVALQGEMTATRGNESFELRPQARNFFAPVMQTSEAALLTRWDGQLYAVIASVEESGDTRWQIRLWWKPFVTLIWAGGVLIALGGLLALLGRITFAFRLRRRATARGDY